MKRLHFPKISVYIPFLFYWFRKRVQDMKKTLQSAFLFIARLAC